MEICVLNKKKFISDNKILMDLWDHDENKNLDPRKILIGTDKIFNWHCKNGKLCEHKFSLCPRKVLKNKVHCPFCCGRKACKDNCLSTTHPEITKQWDYHKNGNKKPEDYTKGSFAYIWWKCDKNKHPSYESRITDKTYYKTGCPKCKASKGEKKIAEILNKMNLKFKTQVKFQKCKNKKKLPFDFMVKIEKRGFLIEYNGRQHYEEIKRSKEWPEERAEEELKKIQHRDKIKKEYAEKFNIPLLIIPYSKIRKGLSEYDMIKNFLEENYPDYNYTRLIE